MGDAIHSESDLGGNWALPSEPPFEEERIECPAPDVGSPQVVTCCLGAATVPMQSDWSVDPTDHGECLLLLVEHDDDSATTTPAACFLVAFSSCSFSSAIRQAAICATNDAGGCACSTSHSKVETSRSTPSALHCCSYGYVPPTHTMDAIIIILGRLLLLPSSSSRRLLLLPPPT